MALIDEGAAHEIVSAARAARELAHEQLAHQRGRLRSTSKTRKSAQTRQRIMTAASELMLARGDTGFSMSEVSDRCGMSKGSIYYYFADRDELIRAIFDESIDELVAGMEQVVAQSPSAREALGRLYGEFVRRLRSGSPLSLAVTYQLGSGSHASMPEVTLYLERVARVMAAQLERAKVEGLMRPDVDSSVAALFITGGLVLASLGYMNRQVDEDPDQMAAMLLDMMLRGVGTEGATLV